MLELLAPAGDLKSFETAINCGADAVYLGLSDFNARRKAENFTADNLRECVKRAHFYGVKVYITVNTLVRDNEMSSLIALVRAAVEAKADAFIVQDLGVANCLKSAFPNIVLHASTQLGVHNLYGAKIAEEIGFKRVVLSRETKLDDIREISRGTGLEIEYFIQGALCVAFSGNCYLSAAEQDASGNRGVCKQLCRLPYSVCVNGKNKSGYILSAKDLCLADSIQELVEAGVTSFKIEGRLRRESYVGEAVSVYRRILDSVTTNMTLAEKKVLTGAKIESHSLMQTSEENLYYRENIAGNANTKLTLNDREKLKIAYCRGGGYAERAYLDEGTPNLIESKFNNHTGLEIGEVVGVGPFKTDLYKIYVRSDRKLSKGDGLKFFVCRDSKGESCNESIKSFDKKTASEWKEVASLGVGDVTDCGEGKYAFVTKTPLKVGWRMHLISTSHKNYDARKMRVTVDIIAMVGKPLMLSATTVSGVSASVSGEVCEAAKTSPMSAEIITEQATKTADSGFCVIQCNVQTNGVFIAKSVFNGLRRMLFSELYDNVVYTNDNHDVKFDNKAINDINQGLNYKFDMLNIRFMRNKDDFSKFDNSGAELNDCALKVICPENYSISELKMFIEKLSAEKENIALQLPIIANGKDLKVIEKTLAAFPEIKTLVSENIYGFAFVKKGYRVIAGAGHNVLNGYAKAECEKLGAVTVLPSIESERRKVFYDCGEEIPLMTFAHCPYKTIYANGCDKCKYSGDMIISREGREYKIRRIKLHNCYFGLYSDKR